MKTLKASRPLMISDFSIAIHWNISIFSRSRATKKNHLSFVSTCFTQKLKLNLTKKSLLCHWFLLLSVCTSIQTQISMKTLFFLYAFVFHWSLDSFSISLLSAADFVKTSRLYKLVKAEERVIFKRCLFTLSGKVELYNIHDIHCIALIFAHFFGIFHLKRIWEGTT